ncbi:MAG: metallophosphoesterase [Chloroflexi bacterium]|nr:MAG: metallophosphoesterase [Chloroflexota bacterium]
MRIAIIADIHGNLVALESVLAALHHDAPDMTICLGDVAATGPRPRDVIARLRTLGCQCVLGNADDELLQPLPQPQPGEPRWLAIDRWCAAQLSAGDRAFLASFAPTLTVDLPDGAALLAYHGAPASYDQLITTTTAAEDLDALLAGTSAAVYAGGHTHAPFIRAHHTCWVLNPGSVGLRPPNATYALIDATAVGLAATLRSVQLDMDTVLEDARRSGMPEYDWWSSFWRAEDAT